MAKRKPVPSYEEAVRDARDRAFRKLRGLFELHFSMLGSYASAEKPDAELRLRLLNNREAVMDLVDAMLPTPGVPLGLALVEDEAEPDTVH